MGREYNFLPLFIMNVEFSREDYLWLEIQKHLLELQQFTTDVTYNQVVYKVLMDNLSNSDILSYVKTKYKSNNPKISLDYLDYVENKNRFVLQQVLEVLKVIVKKERNFEVSEPQKFFYTTLKRITAKNFKKATIFSQKQTKAIINNYTNSSTKSCSQEKSKIQNDAKLSTVYNKV